MNKSFVFFGTPEFSVTVLDELKVGGYLPSLIVTTPDKPQGRHMVITPSPVKVWATANNVPYIQPATLKTPEIVEGLKQKEWDAFVVCAYGKIIPQAILDIPIHGCLNVHPSLLPKLRGPSPVQSSILSEDKTGVTIIRLDALMDHGPIVAQKEISTSEWPPYESELENILAHEGGKLLTEILPAWFAGKITETVQDESAMTLCKKIQKEDAVIDLSGDAMENLRKIRAFERWPRAHTVFHHEGQDFPLIIKRARVENNELVLERVIPPGRKEMSWDDFKHGFLGKK